MEGITVNLLPSGHTMRHQITPSTNPTSQQSLITRRRMSSPTGVSPRQQPRLTPRQMLSPTTPSICPQSLLTRWEMWLNPSTQPQPLDASNEPETEAKVTPIRIPSTDGLGWNHPENMAPVQLTGTNVPPSNLLNFTTPTDTNVTDQPEHPLQPIIPISEHRWPETGSESALEPLRGRIIYARRAPPSESPESVISERIRFLERCLRDDFCAPDRANIATVLKLYQDNKLKDGDRVYVQFGQVYLEPPEPAPGSAIWVEDVGRVRFQYMQQLLASPAHGAT